MIMMSRHPAFSRSLLRACVIGAALGVPGGSAWGQVVPRALSTAALAKPPAPAAPRSVVFDSSKADDLRFRQQPAYIESITVEGRDPDSPRGKRKSLEQNFAEALLAPPPAAALGLRSLSPTPCYAIQSSLNTIGNSYAPLTGCPGFTNSP